MQKSVFMVASDLFRLSDVNEIHPVKLQKLVYYAFGWYAKLTSRALFGQKFYAMKHGPVVGELLTAHMKKTSVSRELMESASDAFGDSPQDADPFYDAVLNAVLDFYGKFDTWSLRDKSHEEQVWIEAWGKRTGERSEILAEDIIDYFLLRTDTPEELLKKLPESQVTYLSSDHFDFLERMDWEFPESFVRSIRKALK